MEPLNLETVRKLARDQVNRMGEDFRYCNGTVMDAANVCYYVPTTDPRLHNVAIGVHVTEAARETGCLVGSMLEAAGLMNDTIASWIGTIGSLIQNGEVKTTGEIGAIKNYLTVLQTEQDRGRTWGEALAKAEAMLEEYSSDD
jgi:hypothetical protein